MNGIGTAPANFHLPGLPVDTPLIVFADRAVEDDPVAFLVADTLMLIFVEHLECGTLHGI